MINCPHCGHTENTVRETQRRDGYYRRYRICQNCHNSFCTHEVLAVYAGKARGMVLDELALEEVNQPITEVHG